VPEQQPAYGANMPAYGGGATDTVLHPVVMVALVLAAILLSVLPRKYAVLPFLLVVFLVPRGQQIYFAGQHWYALRILVILGLVRLARGKFQVAGGMNGIDKVFIVWAICHGVNAVLHYPEAGMVAAQAAFWLEAFGGYFLLRHLVQDEEDIAWAAKTFAVLAFILGACMLNEKIHGLNVFGYLGGAPLTPTTRDGEIRAQAIFGHPILAGSFGATLLPLFVWLWTSGRSRSLAFLGAIGSTLMVYTSASSTPLLAYAAGMLALGLWPMRRSMRLVRWGVVLTIVGLQVVMNAPVWFVLQYMNVIGASGGWDRAELIDVFIRHFKDWWLIGAKNYSSWGWDMWDLSNQFVAEGETSGLLTLVCFIALISRSFSRLGKMRKRVEGDKKQEWFYWCLCAVMVAHIFAYFGVSYWDQVRIWWWAFLAMVSAASSGLRPEGVSQPGEKPAYEFAAI